MCGSRGPPSPPAMPQQPAIPDWPDLPPVVMPPDWPSEEFLFNQPNTPNRPYAPPESPMYPPWAPDAPLLPPPGWPQAPPLPVGDQPPLPPSVPDFPNTSMDTYYGETYDWEENGVEEESYDQHAMRVMSVHGSSGHHDMSVMSVDERDDGIGPGTTVEPVDPVNHPELLDALRPRSQHQGHVNGGYVPRRFHCRRPMYSPPPLPLCRAHPVSHDVVAHLLNRSSLVVALGLNRRGIAVVRSTH